MILYSRTTCAPCRTIKYWLDKNQVSYKVRDIDDPSNLDELLKTGSAMVPTIVVNGVTITGVNIPALKNALQLTN